ncbi:molybdenum cofactor guanylyltransferase [Luteipulveratus halotolerans]|uniref:MobA-like NTP transferase domain-containing protein n=1 Tax=Luteipulveratus halotolerans TaxID=1631356 RepID=A0A0L6CL80_9MICO|nr:NTP transferase domain-containing protein [Luteipulveratus halotolerans]KNX38464.1 hypothetical protein VV01_17045 [Luteipulveratus halotolerans]
MSDVTAVVLCGGRSSRFGSDKTRAPLGATTVLDRLLADLPEHWPVVAVGERRRTSRDVTWTRESPAFAGPLAAVEAALPLVDTSVLVLIAGDMPYAGRAASQLVAALGATSAGTADDDATDTNDAEAVVAIDPSGRRQPLLAAYRTDVVRRALPQPTANAPMRRLLDALTVAELPVGEQQAADVDTPADLERLERPRD